MQPVILIPARMASTRLPNKPLADIHGKPMIVHVLERAKAAGAGEVWVATDHFAIRDAVEAAGGKAVMTREDHPSGSDRIYEALGTIDPEGAFDVVVNLQGDIPSLSPGLIHAVTAPLANNDTDIATLAAPIHDDADKKNPAVVKIAMSIAGSEKASPATAYQHFVSANEFVFDADLTAPTQLLADHPVGRALYFSRAPIPTGTAPMYHHIGIYAYKRRALEQFVKLPPSPLELSEKLEQLRALEAGMRMDVAIVDKAPMGVDTPEQLEQIRKLMVDS